MCSVCASAHSDALILFDNSNEFSRKQLTILKRITSNLINILDSKNTDNRVGLISIGGKAHLQFGLGSNGEQINQWISEINRTASGRDVAGAFEISSEQAWTGFSDRKRHLILVTDRLFCEKRGSEESKSIVLFVSDEHSNILGMNITIND
ncbi:hypothetical protein PFISCL1PPCAC_26515, partial [Pristionchus fissidentatus]